MLLKGHWGIIPITTSHAEFMNSPSTCQCLHRKSTFQKSFTRLLWSEGAISQYFFAHTNACTLRTSTPPSLPSLHTLLPLASGCTPAAKTGPQYFMVRLARMSGWINVHGTVLVVTVIRNSYRDYKGAHMQRTKSLRYLTADWCFF